jgi:mannose-6-phosphate isomerase-like protein (cupin superfamily)
MITAISLRDKIKEMSKPWFPVEVARVNDHVVRIALYDGEYPWHKHANEDELFFVYKGSIVIQMKGQQDVTLREGEMAVMPRGVEHSPRCLEPSYVLMFEPQTLKSRGD